jgi:hypothetical protein
MLPLDIFVTLLTHYDDNTQLREARTVSRDYVRELPACTNPLAQSIAAAGWHGVQNRIAWAIAQRESNGQPDAVSNSGGYGLMQLQAAAHAGNAWWDWSDVLTTNGNLRQARALWRVSGWQPWGIAQAGNGWRVDASAYSNWDSATIDAWIRAPFAKYWAAYPCRVAP